LSFNARSRMTMRCTIERNMHPGATDPLQRDGFGQAPPQWQDVGGLIPCFAWAGGGENRTRVAPERVVAIDTPGMMLPLGTDVRQDDRIAGVWDRRGNEIFGAFTIDDIFRRKGYLLLSLQEFK
jgi:hypothetical protein